MTKKKILFISPEITPYLPETELSHIGRYLPQGIQERGKEIRVFMPRFGCVNERRNQLHEVIRLSGMNLIISDSDHPLIIKVASIQSAHMQVYFIDNEDYFQRKHTTFDEHGNAFADNDERIIFFAKGVFETVKKLQWSPDLIYCQGWFTAMVPLILRRDYANDTLFSHAKIVYSTTDNGFEGRLNEKFSKKLLSENVKETDVAVVTDPTFTNVNKLAIDFSDGVIFNNKEINPELKAYAAEQGKPSTDFPGMDTYIDAYSVFFDQLLGND